MSSELRPPTFRYVHSFRRRWLLALAVATVSTFLIWGYSAGNRCLPHGIHPEELLLALGSFWLVLRIARQPRPLHLEPRESDAGPISRIILPGPIPGTRWLFGRELQVQADGIVIRSRFSSRRILRREIASITPLPGELVIQLVESETVRITTCRLPSSFGPLDVAFDHTLRAAGFAGLSYNERIARAIEGEPKIRSAYRSAA